MLTRWHVFLSLSASMMLPSLGHALTVGDIEVQSAVNEPFRAKIPLTNVNVPLSDITTKMASKNDYARLGIDPALAPNLQFRVQDSGNGTAVLWLSSNEPVNSSQVDLLISVGANQDKTLHQMSAALKPSRLPAPTSYAQAEVPLVPLNTAPPPMSVSSSPTVDLPQVNASDDPIQAKKLPQVAMNSNAPTYDAPVQQQSLAPVAVPKAPALTPKKPTQVAQAPNAVTPSKPAQSNERKNYRVVRRDTLWDIAMRISQEQGLPINKVMDSIQALNQNAFIRNNPNLLKSGVTLTIPRYDEVNELASSLKKATKKTSATKKRQSAIKARKAQKRNAQKHKQRAKARMTARASKRVKKLKKAEMRIVAPSAQGNAQGEVTPSRNTTGNNTKLPPQIKVQVQKSRSATISQRKRVNKLNTQLSNYSKKIQLQNAKLAELESRLKQLNKKAKPSG